MPKGWGIGATDEKVLFPDPPTKEPIDRVADDIHAIRQRAVLPILEQKYLLLFSAAESTAGVVKVIDTSTFISNSIIISMITGTIDFWLGDDAAAGGIPDMRFTPVGTPQQLLLTPKTRRFSFLANGGAATGKIIVSAV